MPENEVSDLITDQEIAFVHSVFSGSMTDQRAAEAVGLNPNNAAYISGRKGFGVKADALLDKLTAAAKEEVDARHPQRSQEERQHIAHLIAVGALRYFMLKFTRNSVIAFDFKEALSFEGETGPYVQYAVVRARNIFRKAGVTPEASLAEVNVADYLPAAS
jgi:arginyl-tRNA synthetase